MDFDAFIAAAWSDHADHAEAVAGRLEASLQLITAAAHFAPYARLATHVFGEHLGRWDDGIALLASMRRLPAFDGSESAEGPLRRGCAALDYAAHADESTLAALAVEDRVMVLATASSSLAGQRAFARAITAYDEALAMIADRELPAPSPAHRALAIGGNNLAAALEQHAGRSDAETKGMLAAAAMGLKFWKLAGTWLEEERAEYRLSQSRLQAGLAFEATLSAQRCIAICKEHGAPAFELFFGYAALASAQKAAGRMDDFDNARALTEACHAQIPAEDRVWCAGDLEQLRAAPPVPA